MIIRLTYIAMILAGLSACDDSTTDRSLKKSGDTGEISDSSLLAGLTGAQVGVTPGGLPGGPGGPGGIGVVGGGIGDVFGTSGGRKCTSDGKCSTGCEYKYGMVCYYDSSASTNNPEDPNEITTCEACEHQWHHLVTLEKDEKGEVPQAPFAPFLCPATYGQWPLNTSMQKSITATSMSNTNTDPSTWGGVDNVWGHDEDKQCAIQGFGRYQRGGADVTWSYSQASQMCVFTNYQSQ